MNPISEYVEVLPVAPQGDVDLDIRSLTSLVAVDDDGDPVLVLRDDDTTVLVEFGLGGAWESAIQAAERLSVAAQRFASALREVRVKQRASSVASNAPAEMKEEPCR